jgi:hypothetical protein
MVRAAVQGHGRRRFPREDEGLRLRRRGCSNAADVFTHARTYKHCGHELTFPHCPLAIMYI